MTGLFTASSRRHAMARPELHDTTALILAGGAGTRLRVAVSDRPKILAPVGNQPFAKYLLQQVAAAGLRTAVLCTGYLSEMVEREFGEVCGKLRLSYSPEDQPLGTGGALRLALPKITSRWVLVLNGDSYCDVNLSALWKFHHQRRADCSMVLARVNDRRRFGSVRTDNGDRVLRFEEKGEGIGGALINAGIYLMDRELIEDLPVKREISLEREVFPTWIRRRFFGFRRGGRFIDIGTPQSYAAAETFFVGKKSR